MAIDLNRWVKTRIRIRTWDSENRLVKEQFATNQLTYAAAGVLATALIRSGPSQVTWLYGRFGNTPSYLAPTDGDLASTERADFIEGSYEDGRGGLWVPILSAPVQETDDVTLYNGNKLTFLFRIPASLSSSQISPAAAFSVTDSRIYALGLAISPNAADRTQDVIISVLQATGFDEDEPSDGSFEPIEIPNNGQASVDYEMSFKLATE